MKGKYIRGRRQIIAIYYAFWALFTGNWLSLKRELFIITGFAKPYGIRFAPSFWESMQKNYGFSKEEAEQFKEEAKRKFGQSCIPEEDELPTIDEFVGSDPNYTGDMTTEEYIRSMKSG